MMLKTRNLFQFFKYSLSYLQPRVHNVKYQAYFFSIDKSYLDLNDDEDDFIDEKNESIMNDILPYKNNYNSSFGKRNVFVIMPRQKIGVEFRTKEKAMFLMDETKTLVHSLSGWEVVASEMISSSSIHAPKIFGKTNLKILRDYIHESSATTVVFAVDYLKPIQAKFFKEYFNTEVLDRFSLVLNIFRERAGTKEAKLQLRLAELRYIRRNLHHLRDCDFENFSISKSYGGSFDTYFQTKKLLIEQLQMKIQKKLQKFEQDNIISKKSRSRREIPSIAVIGYTNSGKTSLIKALTHDKNIMPEDKLFATVSTTIHQVNLPVSKMKAFYIDTIGFITEMPTALIHCFKSTLSEICSADLIIHVTDISHPDYQLQIDTVHETLEEINVPQKLIDTMIQVENKVDKLDQYQIEKFISEHNDCICISANERIGLDEVSKEVELKIIENTDRIRLKIRISNGGEQYQWLRKEVTVIDAIVDTEKESQIILDVIMTKSQVGKFKKRFG